MNQDMLTKFNWFIKERELIRAQKEEGSPKPWTKDPVLQSYRFCNVNRNDDKVSKWIYERWINPNENHPNLPRAILLSRLVNWPDTLNEIGFPYEWNPTVYAKKIGERIRRGDKTWTGAYMVTAEMDGTPKHESVCKTVDALDFPMAKTCLEVWKQLQVLPRIGSFMAAQVVADLKRTKYLGPSPDYWSFCAPGPGSMKGLNKLLDKPEGTYWAQPTFQKEVNELQIFVNYVLDAQNVQNCLCEFHKWTRGSSRSKYPGA